MPFDYVASQDSYILAGAIEAYTTVTGVPNGTQFLMGTAHLNQQSFGIVVSCTVKTLGERSKVKGASGVTIAEIILDPGYSGSVSILSAKEKGRPAQGQILGLTLPSKTPLGADAQLSFFIMDASMKWEREGFRMYDIEVERREALFEPGRIRHAYNVNADGTLATLIASDT